MQNEINVDTATLGQLKNFVGGLSKPSKMPGYAYGLPAKECKIGSVLANEEGSVCEKCYALRGYYVKFKEAKLAQYRRLEAVTKDGWAGAMIRLIGHYSSEVFRWHDAGDLQSLSHLSKIAEIARALPGTGFWLPTREVDMARRWITGHNDTCSPTCGLAHFKRMIPTNLNIRLSAFMIDTRPPVYSGLTGLTTSTVHTKLHLGAKGESIVCGAPARGGECGSCRACWSPKVANVSYHKH